jgi:peptidoglycan/LPS O-acetylase OafA/YrhL
LPATRPAMRTQDLTAVEDRTPSLSATAPNGEGSSSQTSQMAPPPALPSPAVQHASAYRENPNLDFLRTFAVLLVLLGHLTCFFGKLTLGPWNLLLMGSLGVLFFFVHTCMVLMLSLERRWQVHFSPTVSKFHAAKDLFVEFMIRRCFRIYPLSITAIILIVAFNIPQGAVEPGRFVGFHPDSGDLLANLFLVQNLAHRVPLLGPIWSLPYELQMYLLLPALFLFVRGGRPIARLLAVWTFATGVAVLVAHNQPNPSLLLFIPCFLPGVLAYLLQSRVSARVPAFLWPLFVAALSAIFLVASSGGHWIAKWSACLLLGLAIPMFMPISARWLVTASHHVAKYSYGIYLTHFFATWFSFEYLGSYKGLQRVAAFLILATALPVLFYHAIEEPMIRLGKHIADRHVARVRTTLVPAD